mmetsp:Transcript_65605/g.181137  ORF Transcript_65605/g.181137 Transcript_65605/m.181137 type:complete len:231 (-) Transcript_65605:253-945(-)
MCSMKVASSEPKVPAVTPAWMPRSASRYMSARPAASLASREAGLPSAAALYSAHCCACATHALPSARSTAAESSGECAAGMYSSQRTSSLSAASMSAPPAQRRCLLACTMSAMLPLPATVRLAVSTWAHASATHAYTTSKAACAEVQMALRARLSSTEVHTKGREAFLLSLSFLPGSPVATCCISCVAAMRAPSAMYVSAHPTTVLESTGCALRASHSFCRADAASLSTL